MKSTMYVMGWVSLLVCFAIAGMGGAPIAEYYGIAWLEVGLRWLAYVSVGLLSIATLLIGGLGMYHGILTVLGRSPGTVTRPPAPATAFEPKVEEVRTHG